MFVKFNLCIRVGNWLVAQMVGGNGRRTPFGAFNTSQWGSGTARAEFSHQGKILRSGALRISYFKIIIVWKPNSRAHGPALKRNPLAPRPKKIICFLCLHQSQPNQVLESGLGAERSGAVRQITVRSGPKRELRRPISSTAAQEADKLCSFS